MKVKDVKIGKRFRKDIGDLDDLKNSIEKHGLFHPIVVDKDNNLIVGERRLQAFKELGHENIPHRVLSGENRIEKENDENVVRKNWTPSEAVDIWEALQKHQGIQLPSESDGSNERRKRAANLTGYSTDTLSKAKQVLDYGDDELITKMDQTHSVNPIYRKVIQKRDEEDIKKNPPKPIQGKFKTIVIDPPWSYEENIIGRTKPEYALMSMEDLKEMNLMEHAEDTCHLYLWTTNAFIWKGIDLGKEWGFKYKTCLTWVKPSIGIGTYFRNSTEHVLFFIKEGSKSTRAKDIPTHFEASRGKHSEKPEEFYKIVEKASYPPYLDIFGRKKRKGWYVYGNIKEVKNDR